MPSGRIGVRDAKDIGDGGLGMEPDGAKPDWDLLVSPRGKPTHRTFGRLRRLSIHITAALVLFAMGFTTRSIFSLQPKADTVGNAANSASMIARTTGTLSTGNAVSSDAATNVIVVDVHGDVVHPGVYRLPITARVEDAVHAAGGLQHSIDAQAVNLAATLSDGEEVVVPNAAAPSSTQTTTSGATASAAATNKAAASNSIVTGSTATSDTPINLNTADETTLETLPGVGPGRAAAIVQYRTKHGPFSSVSAIQQVRGIGPGIYQRIQPYLVVAP